MELALGCGLRNAGREMRLAGEDCGAGAAVKPEAELACTQDMGRWDGWSEKVLGLAEGADERGPLFGNEK